MTVDELLAEFRSAVPLPDRETTARAFQTATATTAHRRARRLRQLIVVGTIVVAACVLAAVALGMGLFGKHKPPFSASASPVGVVTFRDPQTGHVLARVSQWVNHQGVCYLVPHRDTACVPRSPRGSTVARDRLGAWGLTFDTRVDRAIGILGSGAPVPFRLSSLEPPLDVVFFFAPSPNIRTIELLDRSGRKLHSFTLSGRR